MAKLKLFLLPIMWFIVCAITFLIDGDFKSALHMLGKIGNYISTSINVPIVVYFIIFIVVILLLFYIILYTNSRYQGDKIQPQNVNKTSDK